MWFSIKPKLARLVAWTVKHHWIFLVAILFVQWLTGQVLAEPLEWGRVINPILARQIHLLNSKVIVIVTILMALDKLFLYLSRKGKI